MTTPAQLAALQSLCGTGLTADQITGVDGLVAQRNDAAIAALLSQGRSAPVKTLIGIGTVLATLGADGGAFLDTLVAVGAQDRNVYWAMELIRSSTLDIGMAATRGQMQALAQAIPALAPGVSAILALAVQPAPINVSAVSDALNAVEAT